MLGGYSIDQQCLDKILELEPKIILELGSGQGTGHLAEKCQIYSIEHNPMYLNKYNSKYIYAPIRDGWYDLDEVELPVGYDLILVDGPPSTITPRIRIGFYEHFHLFDPLVPIIIDDVNRAAEYYLMEKISQATGRPFKIYGDKKQFAIV